MLFFKNSIVLFFSLLLCYTAKSQNAEQYSITHYGLQDGLASNIVNNAVQDDNGFIWLSTNNGLQRFDGNKFITFRSKAGDATTLPSDEINQIYQDKHNNLWVLTTDNRVGVFDTRRFTYKEVQVNKTTSERMYVDKLFVETADGNLLLLFRKTNQLFQLTGDRTAFVPSKAIPVPRHWTINFLLQDKRSNNYFLSTDSGLVVYSPETGNLNHHSSNPDKIPVITHCGAERSINYLFLDAEGSLLFEQWHKNEQHPVLHFFNAATGMKQQLDFSKAYGLGYHQIRAVLEQRNGKTWIYGLPFLAEFSGISARSLYFLKKDYNKEKDLKFNQVHNLSEDRQHNIWACTDNGVYLFNPDAQFFHNYSLTTPKRFSVEGKSQTALQLSSGEIWIGYRDLGLQRYDKNINALPLPPSLVPVQEKSSVWDIHEHSKSGKVWITMQGGKLIIYDQKTQEAQFLAPGVFGQRAITQLTEDRNGNLWFGTQGGNVVKWDYALGKNKAAEGFSLFLKTGVVEKMFTDRRGRVWVAAIGSGITVIDPERGQLIRQITREDKEGFRLWNNDPKDIYQYNDSILVVASGALNLININNYQVQHISTADGLPTNTVQSVTQDASGKLWLGTMNGLCVTDLQKLSFSVYNQSDGLLNDHFNIAGAHRLKDGRLLFMSAESFLIFDPRQTNKRDLAAKVFITDFRLWSNSLPLDSLLALKQIDLSYKNHVVIEFSALNYNKLNKLDYYYQLEGLDTTWIKSDVRHQVTYAFLPPGKYAFKVRTKNLGGEWNPGIAMMQLNVHPPFYKSWWFFVLLSLLTGIVLYLLYRERIKRLTTLHNIRSDIANHLHEDVSTTLNNINVLSQIAKLKADRDIVRSKELIDEISGKSYNMMVSMDEILWSIDPSNDTMEKTLLRLSEFAKTLETNHDNTIDMVVHEKVKNLQLDMKVRHDFFLICKAALQHLAENANGKKLMLDIDLSWSKIVVKLLSAGVVTEEEKPAMMELKASMEEKAAAMHASLLFEVGKRDTSIILSIPVKPHPVAPYTIFSNRK